jgi:4-amino-4-deoxy-L-arabinose transferase-like glycosyltransferase
MAWQDTAPGRADTPTTDGPRRWHVVLLVALCLGLFLVRAGSLPLADPEEARCALIVQDMLRHGHWWVPQLCGHPYYDKPAPFFLLAAAGVRATGSAELGGRLVPALAGLLAVLVTYAFAARVFASGWAGLVAGLVLATAGEFLFMARWYRMDMLFVAAMWAAVWWFWRGEDRRLGGRAFSKTGMWVGFYVFAAVATLLKGPAGLALPGLIVLAYFLLSRQYRRVVEFFWPAGLGAYLLLAGSWYVAASVQEPEFAREFFVRQNVQRFVGGGGLGHHWPGILFVPILLAGLLPWTIYLPGAAIRYFPRRWRRRAERPAMLLLWLAALIPLIIVMSSSTRLASYVLPVFPPLAVLIGGLVASWTVSHRPDGLMKLGARALIIAVVLLPLVPLGTEVWLKMADAWLVVPFVAALAAVGMMILSLRLAKRDQFVGWAVCGIVCVFGFLILHTAPAGYERMSARTFASETAPLGIADGRVCLWSNSSLSFLFYSGADAPRAFRESGPDDLAALLEWLQSDQRVFCLAPSKRRLRQLEEACSRPLRVLAHDGRFWLVSNQGAPSTRRGS